MMSYWKRLKKSLLIPGPSGDYGNSAVCLYDPDAITFAIFTSD